MDRITNESGHYYQDIFWHAVDFLMVAKPIALNGSKLYEVECFDFEDAPYTRISRCVKIVAKTPQIGFNLMKEEIRKNYKIPKEMQEWLDSDRKYNRRIEYERSKKK